MLITTMHEVETFCHSVIDLWDIERFMNGSALFEDDHFVLHSY
jgi:hypothetical protein